MMKKKDMMHKMSPCMANMQHMTRRMNTMMEKDMADEDRERMAEIMMDMSMHMKEMSGMMKKGQCTMDEMEKMQKKMEETGAAFEELENYL